MILAWTAIVFLVLVAILWVIEVIFNTLHTIWNE